MNLDQHCKNHEPPADQFTADCDGCTWSETFGSHEEAMQAARDHADACHGGTTTPPADVCPDCNGDGFVFGNDGGLDGAVPDCLTCGGTGFVSPFITDGL